VLPINEINENMRYESIDYGDPFLNILAFVGLGIVAFVAFKNVNPPWSNIIGVSCVWAPLILFQFINGRDLLGIILIIVAAIILVSYWNDD
jgi:hypothetical protein